MDAVKSGVESPKAARLEGRTSTSVGVGLSSRAREHRFQPHSDHKPTSICVRAFYSPTSEHGTTILVTVPHACSITGMWLILFH